MTPGQRLVAVALAIGLTGCAVSLREGAVIPSRDVPRFTLKDQAGREVSLDAALRTGPTVVLFYRGHWCMFCRIQLGELAESREEFARRKVKVLAISADTREESIELADRLERAGGVSPLWFPLLADPGARVAEQWGVAVGYEPIAVPSMFVVRPDGSVAWSKVGEDVGDRPALRDLLTVLDSLH